MSGCDRMTTLLGILGLSFAICFFFIAKLYLSYYFLFLLVVAMLRLSSFIYLFCSFYYFSMHCLSCLSCIYIGYGFKVFTHHLSHFNMCDINFKISGGVTAPQWL